MHIYFYQIFFFEFLFLFSWDANIYVSYSCALNLFLFPRNFFFEKYMHNTFVLPINKIKNKVFVEINPYEYFHARYNFVSIY